MRLLICGGRDYNDWNEFNKVLFDFLSSRDLLTPDYNMPRDVIIVHGDCPTGADSLADQYAVVNWTGLEVHPADWDKHGRAAGPIRNQRMLDTGIDVVIAFPGGRGTAHMVGIAKKAGVEVIEVPVD